MTFRSSRPQPRQTTQSSRLWRSSPPHSDFGVCQNPNSAKSGRQELPAQLARPGNGSYGRNWCHGSRRSRRSRRRNRPPGPNFTHSTLAYAATTNLDFDADDYRSLTLAGNVTFTTSNRAAPKALTIRIIADGSTRTFTFPAGWKFIGSAAPTNIAANKEGILSITCFGSADTDIRAVYAVEP